MARKAATERRADIVEAGLRVIAREGMHGATVRAIVAEAEVPLATFHYVFDSRDQMIGEAYAFVGSFITDEPFAALPQDASVEDAAAGLMRAWFGRFLEHPEYELAAMEIMAYCRRTSSLAHVHAEVQERCLQALVDLLEALEQHLGVVSATPARELATLTIQFADGIQYSWLRTGDTEAALRMIERVAVPTIVAGIERRL
ncbi:TetR family transcriptional regulator [Agrococcus sp. SL85]|uniref:TetR/AcrR family transcriptional regulator n=1 Tax=Agrococcus sp. SL85 TaxID=2995141 RepID=UPI00226CC4F6|nr:TetR family transcriptional regulator [Agrococcus sp. SL85]WAC65328.1 TetR family transcriptional regulator [Agrococcus sp. SL85]